MRHRELWSIAAIYASYCLTGLIGLTFLPWGWLVGIAAYVTTSLALPWQDPPSEWRSKCWKARVFRPKKQNKLWESAMKRNLQRVGMLFMAIPKDQRATIGKIDEEWIAKASFSLDGEMITICDAVKVRGGLAIVVVSGPPRPHGRSKKRKLPQFDTAKGLLGFN